MSVKKNVTHLVSINNPCHEDWNMMTATDKGRFCSACSAELRDFSGLTDAEIIAELQKANGKTCGRFLNTQLNRSLVPASPILAIPRPGMFGRIAASLLMLHSLFNDAIGQQKSASTNQSLITNKGSSVNKKLGEIIITGKVLDSYTKLPLKNVVIIIKGTAFKCVTGTSGSFRFQLPDSLRGNTVSIESEPSESQFSDKTSSIVPPKNVLIDSSVFKTEVILYQYKMVPLENVVELAQKFTTGLVEFRPNSSSHSYYSLKPMNDTTDIKPVEDSIKKLKPYRFKRR